MAGCAPPAAGNLDVVTLIASAGGLAAVGAVLRGLPADFPAAVVVLQHLDPERVSSLPRLLAAVSPMPVAPAADGDTLRAGQVVVVPAGRHLLVGGGAELILLPTGQVPGRPSADLLLAALAMTVRERVVAVILTGMGHDGALGVSAVKRMGGVVIVQDRATSQEYGMPGAAIAAGSTDAIMALEDIAGGLVAVLRPGLPVADRARLLGAGRWSVAEDADATRTDE